MFLHFGRVEYPPIVTGTGFFSLNSYAHVWKTPRDVSITHSSKAVKPLTFDHSQLHKDFVETVPLVEARAPMQNNHVSTHASIEARRLNVMSASVVSTLVALVVVFCGPAMASDVDFDLRIGIGQRAPVYFGGGGYYATRYETVLVEPERIVREWVPPTYETMTINGRQVVVQTSPGYLRDFYLAPRYETRAVRVWVPAPVYVTPRPFFSFGFGFSDCHRRRSPVHPHR